MADKAQQQTLSVRITESLRRRLERARQLASSKTGEAVSTSEIAKQFLESARDERLEVIDLLADPTESLLQIRRKGEAATVLSRAEWATVAHFAQHGVETASAHVPNLVSTESLIAVLDAFLAAYSLRTEPNARLDTYYLGNLPVDDRPASLKRASRVPQPDAEAVRRTAVETRRRVAEDSKPVLPPLAARNLYRLLEEDRLAGPEDLNRVLRRFWPALWRLAARGHYVQTLTPVRYRAADRDGSFQVPIPSVSERGYTLHFQRGAATEFSVLIGLPPSRGVHYPISSYPRLNEFRTMLKTLGRDHATSWTGASFLGGVEVPDADRPAAIWFRAHDNGIALSFSIDEWTTLQRLFQRAWDSADIRRAWEPLILEYGEL